ncbi:unnamed protein product [Fusarium equiseti]|uniref:Secreted protein n=1 Tax=Fusarium equiseti TaxID=61235 RepID=A0A8J2IDW2_FUSEQ|nr:unnamed protein product [Fusarium equiseti]
MKFTLLTQAVVAIPMLTGAMAAPTENSRSMDSTVKCVKSWVKSGLDRYRMQLITNPRDDRLLGVYCDLYKKTIGFTMSFEDLPDTSNLQPFLIRFTFSLTLCRAILEANNRACDDFQVITGCQTIRHF